MAAGTTHTRASAAVTVTVTATVTMTVTVTVTVAVTVIVTTTVLRCVCCHTGRASEDDVLRHDAGDTGACQGSAAGDV
jgi:hypothetical protein